MTRYTPERRMIARFILAKITPIPDQDFFTLSNSQKVDLLGFADAVRYREPKNANGSRGRYFYAKLQREAQ